MYEQQGGLIERIKGPKVNPQLWYWYLYPAKPFQHIIYTVPFKQMLANLFYTLVLCSSVQLVCNDISRWYSLHFCWLKREQGTTEQSRVVAETQLAICLKVQVQYQPQEHIFPTTFLQNSYDTWKILTLNSIGTWGKWQQDTAQGLTTFININSITLH